MPHCLAVGCSHEQGRVKKRFFKFPNPKKSAEDRKSCQEWLDRLKNGSLPSQVGNYLWKRTDVVCEDHFELDSLDRQQTEGAWIVGASEVACCANCCQCRCRQSERWTGDAAAAATPSVVSFLFVSLLNV